MPIKCTTPKSEIDAAIKVAAERMTRAVIRNLKYIGEQVVNHARSLPSPSAADFKGKIPPHQPNYIDWTANLRSSIGYVIVVDGRIVEESGYPPVKNGREGSEAGRAYATGIAKSYANGFALIVTAGMHYASYVTAKGYDVIDSAELLAEKLVPSMMKQLGF